ncbi:MAG: HNH endonuclease signature motif containing protein [Cystobacter sp.]
MLLLSVPCSVRAGNSSLLPGSGENASAQMLFMFDAAPSLAGKGSKGGASGSRMGKAFTPAGKKKIDAANAAKNDGVNKRETCGTEVVPGQQSQSGVSPPVNQRERDHVVPRSKGGEGVPENGQVLCRECNLEKSNKAP